MCAESGGVNERKIQFQVQIDRMEKQANKNAQLPLDVTVKGLLV